MYSVGPRRNVFEKRHEVPRERKRQGIRLEPMWTSATGNGRNLESPRALYAAVAMFEIMAVGKKRLAKWTIEGNCLQRLTTQNDHTRLTNTRRINRLQQSKR